MIAGGRGGADLRAIGDAADDERCLEPGAEALRPAMDLLGELARRREHDRGAERPPAVAAQALDDGNHEGRRLAGAGLRGADDVAAFESGGNRSLPGSASA
jgi:hypothetical protein